MHIRKERTCIQSDYDDKTVKEVNKRNKGEQKRNYYIHKKDHFGECNIIKVGQEVTVSPSLTWCCRRLWVCQSIRTTGGHTYSPALARTDDIAVCVCLQMANLVTSLCCVVLAAVVVAYAQRRSQLGEYAFYLLHYISPPL